MKLDRRQRCALVCGRQAKQLERDPQLVSPSKYKRASLVIAHDTFTSKLLLYNDGGIRSSVGAKPTTVAGDNGDHSSSAAEDDSQRHGSSGRNDVMGLLDDEADAEETRAKMVSRGCMLR